MTVIPFVLGVFRLLLVGGAGFSARTSISSYVVFLTRLKTVQCEEKSNSCLILHLIPYITARLTPELATYA